MTPAQRDHTAIGEKVTPPYFFGVHEQWTDIGEDPFATPGWIDHCEASARVLGVGDVTHKKSISLKSFAKKMLRGGDLPKHLALPLSVIRKITKRQGRIRVLDIGGGYGDNYYLLNRCLSLSPSQLSFHVVDNRLSCLLGERLFGTTATGLAFHDRIPEGDYDLVTVIGTIQYIRDWRGFIRSIARLQPSAIYISRTPIRISGTTFLTLQSICPASGSHALRKVGEANVSVIGSEDLRKCMLDNGYGLAKKKFQSDYSKQFSRLPPAYRNVAYVDSLWEPQRGSPALAVERFSDENIEPRDRQTT
jgi:putative methyltransferase (TIGR04325 family)